MLTHAAFSHIPAPDTRQQELNPSPNLGGARAVGTQQAQCRGSNSHSGPCRRAESQDSRKSKLSPLKLAFPPLLSCQTSAA